MQPACAGRSEIGRSEVCSEDVSNTAKASVPQSMNDQVGGRQEVGVWSETGGRRVECFEDIEELAVECSSWRTLSEWQQGSSQRITHREAECAEFRSIDLALEGLNT